jgi:hypothetical protein
LDSLGSPVDLEHLAAEEDDRWLAVFRHQLLHLGVVAQVAVVCRDAGGEMDGLR